MISIEELYQLFCDYPVISTDSRQIQTGSIFFALKGENFNGNKFASDSLEKGAAFSIVDEEKYVNSDKTILVNNVLDTLSNLANFHRIKLKLPILAITGTNGKTTTKELVSTILAQKFNVDYTEGNLNNHIGVPLTLLKMNTQTEFGVIEMGANHPGEIAHLCKIAEPDFGIITNIGKAHLEGFGSFDGVIKTKSELYNYIKSKNGKFFYNCNNPIIDNIAKDFQNKITYGFKDANFTGELLKSPPFVNIKANFKKGVLYLNTNLIGDYNFENVMAAACIGNYFDIDPLKIQKALKAYVPENNRSQLINKGDVKVIMDAYNANPTSMQASIKSFMLGIKENTYLILGDMLELGEYSVHEHKAILLLLEDLQPAEVFLVGPVFSRVNSEFNFKNFTNVTELILYLRRNPIKKGNVLIKGSRGIQLEKAMDAFN